MIVGPSQAIKTTFFVKKGDDPVDADATPFDAFVWQGKTKTAIAVTIAATAETGKYSAEWTNAGLAAGDQLRLEAKPAIDGKVYTGFVWEATVGPVDANIVQLLGQTAVEDGDVARESSVQTLQDGLTSLASAGVTVLSPVRQDGSLNDLIVGDSYLLAHERAIVIDVTVAAGLAAELAGASPTVHLGFLSHGKTRTNPAFLRYEFPGAIVSIGATTVVRFELTTEQTRDILPGKYDYDIEFRIDGNYVTSVSNKREKPMRWVESATELATS